MMRTPHSRLLGPTCGILFFSLAAVGVSVPAFAACKMAKMAELPVTMMGLKPMIDAKINDKDVRFEVDSGAFYSMLSAASAAELNLKLKAAPYGMRIIGIGGATKPVVANVETFTLAGIPVHNMGFFISDSVALGGGSVGLLGQNVFGVSDVEYDFANGKIRFIKSDDCPHAMLAYWVDAGKPYSFIDIDPISNYHTHITGNAYLNGAKIGVTFDTGANVSLLSLRAAERAGIDPKSPGVVGAGYVSGIGAGTVRSYVAAFSSFKVGDEEIHNARLRFGGISHIGGIGGVDTDMLIGADFFLSHRVYLAISQHKLYFTYNGGPVFNLAASTTVSASAESAAEHLPESKNAAENLDAADFGRRGAASAARKDYVHALADLSRACELAPDNPEFFFERGVVYRDIEKADLAMKDFDRTLELKPDDVLALLDRAELRVKAKDFQGARTDLDAVDRIAAKQADIRFELAQDYIQADLPGQAVKQFDSWQISHRHDSKLRFGLARRCWARALQNDNLDEALSDCDAAMYNVYEKAPGYSDVLGYRGLVRYRMGRYDKSIADYNDVLKLNPKAALSLYSRGLAKIRAKKTAEGEADMAQALKMEPGVADQFNRLGITP
jgi:tetratricopeptide (TPR) repeat protein/predicted aspartyl protease